MQGKYTLTVTGTMDCAHALPDMPEGHKCRAMHGHHYTVSLEVSGTPDGTGIIVDYYDLSAELQRHLARFDHKTINDEVDFPPTTERLCEHFAESIRLPSNAMVAAVTIDVTPGHSCRFEPSHE